MHDEPFNAGFQTSFDICEFILPIHHPRFVPVVAKRPVEFHVLEFQ